MFAQENKIMEKKNIKYVIGLDLSTVSTGICLYSTKDKKFLEATKVVANKGYKTFMQFQGIHLLFNEWSKKHGLTYSNTLFIKEAQPKQYGMKTTINTLLSIAKIHGLVEYYAYSQNGTLIEMPAVTARKFIGNYKADKIEVHNKIIERHPYIKKQVEKEYDITDSMLVAIAYERGWDNWWLEEIKNLNKEKSKFKSDKKKLEIEQKILEIKNKYLQ